MEEIKSQAAALALLDVKSQKSGIECNKSITITNSISPHDNEQFDSTTQRTESSTCDSDEKFKLVSTVLEAKICQSNDDSNIAQDVNSHAKFKVSDSLYE